MDSCDGSGNGHIIGRQTSDICAVDSVYPPPRSL